MLSIGQRNALHRPSESIPFVVLKRSVFSERGLKKRIYTLLFKTYRHIIVSEVCRLAESIAVVA